jgi:hypothetical protein
MQLYDGLQCRQFRDLDLLVPREHIFRAAGLLNELGYREQHVAPLTSFGPRQRKRLIKFNRHVAMCNPSIPGVMVELHWEIGKFGQVSIATERLFSDAHQRVLGKGRFHVLPPQEQAVFLAWHGSVHRWKRLSWLFDFSEAMRSTPEFEETRLLQSARALGVEKHTALALALARTLTGCDVPATVGSLPNVRREMECSCRAIAADETYYENKPLAWLFWSWQMSSSQWLLPRLLIHTFVPSMEHIHLSGPLAYLKRLQRVSSRTCQLLVSKFASIRCQAGVRR